jgi:hypothetical protein
MVPSSIKQRFSVHCHIQDSSEAHTSLLSNNRLFPSDLECMELYSYRHDGFDSGGSKILLHI